MFKLPIKYIGFDGKEKEGDFYFNLTKGDIAKIHVTLPGGFDGFLKKLESEPDVNDILKVFERLILASYGKRTVEGKFIKSKEISEEFAATDAYSELLLKFLDNEDDFVNKFLEGAINMPIGSIQKIIDDNPKLKEAESGDFLNEL